MRVAEAQALAREGRVLRNATTLELLGEHNLQKGEAMGMRSLLLLPQTVIETANEQLKSEDEKAS